MTIYSFKLGLACALVALTAGAATAQEAPPPPRPENHQADQVADTTDTTEAPLTQGLAGPYLAGRIAAFENDFIAAARYFRQAVQQDPTDAFLQDSALVAMVSAGQLEPAAELARTMAQNGEQTELSGLMIRADLARQNEWEALLAEIEQAPEPDAGPQGDALLDGMIAAWAKLGAGRASEALEDFEKLRAIPGAQGMVTYHLAAARAMVGDFEGAAALTQNQETGSHILGDMARAQVLAQLDRRDEAIAQLDSVPELASEPSIQALREKLASGDDVIFDVVESPAGGIAQVFLTFATALANSPEPEPLALIHARLASWLSPELPEARLVTAQLLQMHDQFDLAEQEFDAMRRLGEMRPVAELTRIDALSRADRFDEAEAVALALTAAYPDFAPAWIAQGDLLRQQEKFAAAVPAYDQALSLIPEEDTNARWFPLYARGIALERSGQFDRAEQDFLAAIEIRPDQPSLLNYLGYSWIDRNENLEQGLDLIQQAVELSPNDGYILDSLAWAYYRLGRYQDAVEPMEQAARSMSSDPLVNDHLGDVYWMVGRKREAEIQWQRALSLEPTETEDDVDPDRIRDKLDRGLDAVLADEGVTMPEGQAQTSTNE